MAWASSGGYPGVVSDGNGGIRVAGIVRCGNVFVLDRGAVVLYGSFGVQKAILNAGSDEGTEKISGGIGVFDHAVPASPTTGGAHTAGGTYTAVEQAMIEAAYTALQSIGLVT